MEVNNTNMSFKILQNDTVGRYAVSDSDFSPGDIIFTETPFAVGPKSEGPPVCLGCYIPVDCATRCSSCKWPICGIKCETVLAHKEAECAVFTKAKVRFQGDVTSPCLQYECIMPIRVLLSMLRYSERWDYEVKEMEAHNSIRSQQFIWNFNQINIVNYIRGPCKLINFTEELIHTVCGILECNAFEARSKSGFLIRCLYPKLAILSHNCVPNITHTIDDDKFAVTVRASTAIRKGEELFSSYTYVLWPTVVRSYYLNESKYFQCTCKRCLDPTELGTHMSSLLCMNCTGILTCVSPIKRGDWKCCFCENKLTHNEVKALFTTIQNEIDQNLSENLLIKYNKILHPNNGYLIIIKSSLIEYYRLKKNYSKAIECAKNVLQVVDVVQPQYTRIRGVTLYELFLNLILAPHNSADLDIKLNEALYVLRECVKILILEPNTTTEGKIGEKAIYQLNKLEQNFDTIIKGNFDICSVLN